MNFKHEIAIALVIGLLLGTGINFAYFTFLFPKGSWHFTTSAIIAGFPTDGVAPAKEISNVYNGSGPNFEVKAGLWRMTWRTVEYFKNQSSSYSNYFLYFVAPLKLELAKEAGVYDSGIVAKIEIPEDAYSDYTLSAYYAVKSSNSTAYYSYFQPYRYINGYPLLMTGTGIYRVGVSGIACFNVTIEEYY